MGEETRRGIEGLGELAINKIITKLNPIETCLLSCVNKHFYFCASDHLLWSSHCLNELNLTSPVDPSGLPVPSFKVAYQLWREAFSMYPWTLVRRVKKCWDTLKTWLEANFPEVLATLQEGVSEEGLNAAEKSMKTKLPLPTRLLYRFHDGQKFSGKLVGLIGGYAAYDHLVNVFLLPLKQAVYITQDMDSSSTLKYIPIAASVVGNEKVFSLNCSDYQLYVGTSNLRRDGEMMPCVPHNLLKCSGDDQADGVLLWLEEHGRRLHSGMIAVREQGNFKTISQFPEKSPLCTSAVTNGVQVRASALLIPEHSDLQGPGFLFSYSIRMSLVPEGCTVHGMTFMSCQLQSRHWIIRENEVVKTDVNGDGVIGKYPLLRPGDKEFVYESCSSQRSARGSIEGSFTFVPDRLAAPKGDPFKVEVARIELAIPDYIF